MKIQVYGKQNCPYCVKAKTWLDERNLSYTYTDVLKELSVAQLIAIKEQYNMNTVPIIVINDELIGGYTDLIKLDIPTQ
jgi:alkyl hydroperoxide reductase subunit F